MNCNIRDLMPNPNDGYEDIIFGLLKTIKKQKFFYKIIKQKCTYVCQMILA